MSINVLFTSLVGIVFVMVYAFSVHWLIAPVYLLTVPLLGILSSVLSRSIKVIQKVIVAETTALAGVDHRVAAQHRAGEEPRPRRPGNRPPQPHHRPDPRTRTAARSVTSAA